MYKREGVITWVSSEGGPLLLLSLSDANLWRGIGTDLERAIDYSPVSSGTDYSRACALSDRNNYPILDLLPVGKVTGLVINLFKSEVGVFKDEQERLFLVGAERRDDEKETIDALRTGADALVWKAVGLTLNLAGDALLFDSAMAGADAKHKGNGLLVSMQTGNYPVDTTVFQPDKWTKLNVYRFTRKPGGDKRSKKK